MKKMTTAGVAFVAAVILAACGQGSSTAESADTAASESQSTTTASTVQEEATETIFSGTIQEDAATGNDDTIQVFLKDVSAVQDEDDVVKNFQSDGVILHVPIAAFDGEVTDLVQGTVVQVTLKGVPVMTMSIPPQIPGNSIKQLLIVAE